MIQPPTEAASRERQWFILFLGATNFVFLALDLAGGGGALLAAGRLALSVCIIGCVVALRRAGSDRSARTIVRTMAAAGALSFAAVVWGDGHDGPYFYFFSVIPIVFTVAVPDDVPATVLVGIVGCLAGMACALHANLAWEQFNMFVAGFLASTAYAVAGTFLHVKMRRRELKAREEHRLASEQLREAERCSAVQSSARELLTKQLEALHFYANDVFLLLGTGGEIVQCNDRALRAYGYDEPEMLGLNIRDLRTKDALESFDDQWLQAQSGMSGVRFHTTHRRRDGTPFPVEVSSRALAIGAQAFVQSIVRDRTQELAARAASEYQAMLLENLHDAVVGVDANLCITSWNLAAERSFGWAREEVVGRDVEEVLSTSFVDGPSPQHRLKAKWEKVELKPEARARTRSGEWLDVDSTVVPLRDPGGALLGFVTMCRDVTVQKRAEKALGASQERLRRILDTTAEGILVVDTERRIEFVNANAAAIFGRRPEEMSGLALVDLFPEHEREAARRHLLAIERGEHVVYEFEHARSDGTRGWQVFSASRLLGPDGSLAGHVGVFLDVTAHRRAQAQLLQAQKMEAVGRLASGVAHDFNNLLTVILNSASFLLDALPLGEQREDAQQIREAGERAARLVKQLLAFSRKSEAKPMPSNVDTLVRGIEKLVQRTIGEDVSIAVSLGTGGMLTSIDPGHFEQVLMNLAVNARDAMPGGGEIRIATRAEVFRAPPAGCAALAPGSYVVLEVADTGTGIPVEVLPKIFEPFFTTKERGRGTGLGLATVYGIVESAKGRIAVASTPGRGTTFTIYLPSCAAQPESVRLAAEELPRRGRGEVILVVEDEEVVRRTTRKLLERNGFRVLEARNGADALRTLREARVDVVLSDVVMPAMSGDELGAAIRKLHPKLPVLLMSGYSDRGSLSLGAVLAKPFSEAALLAALRRRQGEAAAQGGQPAAA